MRLLLLLLLMVCVLFGRAQTFFVAGHLGGIYEVKTDDCSFKKITQTTPLLDIAYDRDKQKLYGLSSLGICEIDLNTGNTTVLSPQVIGTGMVVDASGNLLVSKSDSLFHYNTLTGVVRPMGRTEYYSSGDLAFVGDDLFLSALGRFIIQLTVSGDSLLKSQELDRLTQLTVEPLGLASTGCNKLVLFPNKSIYEMEPNSSSSLKLLCENTLPESVFGAALKEDLFSRDLLGKDTFLCAGDTLLYQIDLNGASFEWSNGSKDSFALILDTGQVWVRVQYASCELNDTFQVSSTTTPVVDLGPDTTLCVGSSLLLSAYWPGAEYSWKDEGSTSTYLVDKPGIYWAQAYTSHCGESSDTLVVDYHNHEPPQLGSDTFFCQGTNVKVWAGTSQQPLEWSHPDQAKGDTLFVNQADTYWVNLKAASCVYWDTLMVNQVDTPIIDLGPDTVLCSPSLEQLHVRWPNATYQWSTGQKSSFISVDKTGKYWVTATSAKCGATNDTIEITMLSGEMPELGADTSFCENDTLPISLNLPELNLLWSDSSTASFFYVTQPGQIWVKAYRDHCQYFDTLEVGEWPTPSANLGPDTVICDEVLVLNVASKGFDIRWSSGSTDSFLEVRSSGEYGVTLVSEHCGSASDQIVITVEPPQKDWIGNDTLICHNDSIRLSVSLPASEIRWSTGETTPNIVANDSLTYIAEVTSPTGCLQIDSVLVAKVNCDCPVYMANAFSPNSDALNDGFKPMHECHFMDYRFAIYNRWGQCVFESNDPHEEWIGPSEEQKLSPAVFVYLVYYRHYDGKEYFLKGNVSTFK